MASTRTGRMSGGGGSSGARHADARSAALQTRVSAMARQGVRRRPGLVLDNMLTSTFLITVENGSFSRHRASRGRAQGRVQRDGLLDPAEVKSIGRGPSSSP
jgi:hypothetical protein